MSPSESVLKASKSSYGTMKRVFQEGGFDKILVAMGDHELGGQLNTADKCFSPCQVHLLMFLL